MPDPEAKRPRVLLKKADAPLATRGGSVGGQEKIARAALRAESQQATPAALTASQARQDGTKASTATPPAGKLVARPSPGAGQAAVKRPRSPAAHAAAVEKAIEAPGGNEQVVFNVAGKLFRVSAGLIKAYPEGRLARLHESHKNAQQIFVDASPDRFPLILDWYRYGEVYVPKSLPIASIMQDAAWFQLPDEIVVNGAIRTARFGAGQKVGRDLVATVLSKWPEFSTYLQHVLEEIESHYVAVGQASAQSAEGEEVYDFPPFVLPLCGEEGWLDAKNVCSAARARVFAMRLEECGYLSEFTDTDLIVMLPSQLRGEMASQGDVPEEFDGEEEEVAE